MMALSEKLSPVHSARSAVCSTRCHASQMPQFMGEKAHLLRHSRQRSRSLQGATASRHVTNEPALVQAQICALPGPRVNGEGHRHVQT